jgi:hypothetical protein
MKKILFPLDQNHLGICYVVDDSISIEDIIKISIPENTPYKIVEEINVISPFTNCYDFDQENGYKINIQRCKDFWLFNFRKVRTSLLQELDIDFMRAVESKDENKQSEISQKKQQLRDVTLIDLPNTLMELKNTWPEILGKNPFLI